MYTLKITRMKASDRNYIGRFALPKSNVTPYSPDGFLVVNQWYDQKCKEHMVQLYCPTSDKLITFTIKDVEL